MEINRANFEIWFLDYHEGRLSETQQAEVLRFVVENPDLEALFSGFAPITLSTETAAVFSGKELLKQKAIPVAGISGQSIDRFLVSELENQLSTREQADLEEFLVYNPQFERDRKLYAFTKLKADKSLVFGNKRSLKHSVFTLRRLAAYSLSAAASIALLIGIYVSLNSNHQTIENNQVATTTPTVTPSTVEPLESAIAPVQITNTKQEAVLAETKKEPSKSKTTASKPTLRDSEGNLDYLANKPIALDFQQETIPSFLAFYEHSKVAMANNIAFYNEVQAAGFLHPHEETEVEPAPEKALLAFFVDAVKKPFSSKKEPEVEKEPQRVNFWTVAELGVKTYNALSRSEVDLNLKRDKNGNVVSYSLQSEHLDFAREVKK